MSSHKWMKHQLYSYQHGFYHHVLVQCQKGNVLITFSGLMSKGQHNMSHNNAPMTTSWHGNIFQVTDSLWGESTGYQWIPLTKGQWPVDFSHKGPVMLLVMFSLMLAWTNCWTNSRVAGDLRCHEGHMTSLQCSISVASVIISSWLLAYHWNSRHSPPSSMMLIPDNILILPVWTVEYSMQI